MIFILNNPTHRDTIPLSEIFKEDQETVSNVQYEFVKQEESAAPLMNAEKKKPQEEHNIFIIQVASYKEKGQAEKALEQIKKDFSSAYLVTKDLGEKGIWLRIYAGRFEQRQKAEDVLATIKKLYPNSFIISTKSSKPE